MSDQTRNERVVLTAGNDGPNGVRGRLAALSSRFRQSVETRTSSPEIGLFSSQVNTVEPADGVDEYYKVYEDTAIVFTSLWNFASDVWEPGYRVESDNDDVVEFLEDEWLPQAAILFGGKHNDFLPFGKHVTVQRWARGGALIEHVRDNPDDVNSMITGVNFIPPETVSFIPYQHKPILVDPDPPAALGDELPSQLDETRRGEMPAYIQYHRNAPVPTSRDPVPLSQNDVTRTIFNGDAAGVGTDLDNFWGTPVTEIISEDVAGFKSILRDKETAIKNKAYGLWQLAFDRDTLEFTDIDDETGEPIEVTEIIEWSEDDKNAIADEIEHEMGPGSILTHDGAISMDRLDGEVPDLIADLEFYVSNITSALPTPLYVVGFEENINQFVTEGQSERYQQLIYDERQELERTFTDLMERVVENHPDYADDVDVTFKIQPAEEESPVMSMSEDDIARLEQWAAAFNDIRGDVPVDMFVDTETLLTTILQLPDDAVPEDIDEPRRPATLPPGGAVGQVDDGSGAPINDDDTNDGTTSGGDGGGDGESDGPPSDVVDESDDDVEAAAKILFGDGGEPRGDDE